MQLIGKFGIYFIRKKLFKAASIRNQFWTWNQVLIVRVNMWIFTCYFIWYFKVVLDSPLWNQIKVYIPTDMNPDMH